MQGASDNKEKTVNHEEVESTSEINRTEQKTTSSGLEENIAGLLCYVAGFITGIIFLVIEKENKFVRFHAIQSIITFVVILVASFLFAAIPVIGWIFGLLLTPVSFILWIFLMYKAYQGQWFKLPFIGNVAEKQLHQGKE